MIVKIANATQCNEPSRCSGEEFSSPCLHQSYISVFVHGRYRFTIKGSHAVTSNTRFEACKSRIEEVMTESNVEELARYIFRFTSEIQTAPVVGISGIYNCARYITKVETLTSAGAFCSGYKMTIGQFESGAKRICENPDRSTDRYKPFACTQATYLWMMLSGASNAFRWSRRQDFYACDKFTLRSDPSKEFKASWTLGVAVQSVKNILQPPIV